MKKIYIKPTLSVVSVNNESLLNGESGGQFDEGDAKRNDFFWSDDENEANEIAINDVWE